MMQTRRCDVEKYMQLLSSGDPIPGGGGASAVIGAVALSLAQMVCALTAGKKKFADIEEKIQAVAEGMRERRERLLDLADEDAKVFLPLSQAYALPAATEEEKRCKQEQMEPLLLAAAEVPLEMMELAFSSLEDIRYLALYASRLAVSDAGVAAAGVQAGLAGGLLNVRINTKYMKDRNKAEELDARAFLLYEEGKRRAEEVWKIVLGELR